MAQRTPSIKSLALEYLKQRLGEICTRVEMEAAARRVGRQNLIRAVRC